MKEGYVNSEKFLVYTLRMAFLYKNLKPETFDENIPVIEQLDEGRKQEFFCKYLLSWSLKHCIRVEPKEHLNQSLKEIAAILVKRKRLNAKEYKTYRAWAFKEIKKLDLAINKARPSKEEFDQQEYLNSNN